MTSRFAAWHVCASIVAQAQRWRGSAAASQPATAVALLAAYGEGK
jgi:hypothetical protein